MRLSATINVVGAPKLTAFGYVVISLSSFIPVLVKQEVFKGLHTPFPSVKILAISVKFSSKEDMDKLMNLLHLFPLMETLHIKSLDVDEDNSGDIIGSTYYEKFHPIGCIMNHLNSVRLESKLANSNMLEFACFLLARAQVLQIMRIRSKTCGVPEWVTSQRALLCRSHMISSEAEILFQDMESYDLEGLSIQLANTLPDPFDGDHH
uniref:F-box/LRR-repeat protein 15/At3g58940/PEG3-like LRR domain-containing protein n=1 Tax=Leersia perrieri TaxID=77586 RepID=A0A0D9W4L2_9ORYZ